MRVKMKLHLFSLLALAILISSVYLLTFDNLASIALVKKSYQSIIVKVLSIFIALIILLFNIAICGTKMPKLDQTPEN